MVRKAKKVYVRWSIVYMIVPALILAIAAFCGIRFLQYDMKNELVRSHKAAAELIDSQMEKFLITNDTSAKNIAKDRQLLSIMQKTTHDLEFYRELQKLNSDISSSFSGEYISDFAVFNESGNVIMHSGGVFPAESFYMDYCPDVIETFEKWQNLINEKHTSNMYRDKNGDILYFKSIYKNTNYKSESLGTLLLKIPGIALTNEFAESIEKGSANVFISQNGRCIYSLYSGGDTLYEDVPSEKGVFSENGVMYFCSKVGVLNVAYTVNEGNAFKRLLIYENAVGIIAILLLLAGAVFTLFLSRWQYKPIDSLLKRIGGFYGENEKNEFEYISASIDYYEKQQRTDSDKLAKYKETAISHMLARHILKNGCENLKSVFEKCDYDIAGKFHSIVLVYIDNVDEILWTGNERDYQLMHFAIKNVCTELFDEEFSLITLPVNDLYYTGLVSTEREENFTNRLEEIYNKVEEVLASLGISIRVCVGKNFSNIEDLRREYNKTVPKVNKNNNEHSAELVKVWEEVSDTSDIRNAEKRVNEIIEYIKNNYSDCSLTMESIAHHIGLNSRYMLKIFKEKTGVLLKDYVLKIRIDKAKELLVSDLTIEAVARKCGYTSSHSFIRAFKRACGVTPGEFRQETDNEFK